jgi:hypothetical protein
MIFVACGTDFVEPEPVAARADTPVPQATVFRVIPATPVATPTALPTAVSPDGSAQRMFPAELNPERRSTGLPTDEVFSYWKEYLDDTRLVVAGTTIDVHLCADGRLVPASDSTTVSEGKWGFRSSPGEWYEVILSRESRPGRLRGFVMLSRAGESTVAFDEDQGSVLNVVSVTDSKLCASSGL